VAAGQDLFGAVATSKGLSIAELALMSTLVFAGGAQFAASEMWSYRPGRGDPVLHAPRQCAPRADGRLSRAEDARLLLRAVPSRLASSSPTRLGRSPSGALAKSVTPAY
jgi:hypothetical protein